MKKWFILLFMALISFSGQAQNCAVFEFKAGVGLSQADVDGLSGIFITYFKPTGYTMIERTQINKAIEEQNFQRSNMTESQMVYIGKILNVPNIVIGDVNIAMGQYNVDVRIMEVETGAVIATSGESFASGTSYRETMQKLAQDLASQVSTRPTVDTLYGYLKIFPNELGFFQSEPTTIIKQINSQIQYGYNNWRIPSDEEISLMGANGYLGQGMYMTQEHPKGIVILVTDGDDYETELAKEKEALEQFNNPAFAKFGDTAEERRENVRDYMRLKEAVDNGDYTTGNEYLVSLIKRCPAAQESIYVYGAKIYRYLIQNSYNPDSRRVYLDKLMQIYDLRNFYFGDHPTRGSAYILELKARDLATYGSQL